MRNAVAGVAVPSRAPARAPGPRVRWRYGLGFALLLCSLAALVAVGQFAGWIADSQGRARARAAAEYRAGALRQALRQLPAAGSPTAGPGPGPRVGEAEYAGAVQRVGGLLLDTGYGESAAGPTGELTARLTGSSVGGALDGHRQTVVHRCYRFSWAGSTASTVSQAVACPAEGAGDPSASDQTAAAALAGRLGALPSSALPARTGPGAPAGPGPERTTAAGAVDALLAQAVLPPGSTWSEVLPGGGDAVAAVDGAGAGCVFLDLHDGAVTAWAAPLLAPCSAARAETAVRASRP